MAPNPVLMFILDLPYDLYKVEVVGEKYVSEEFSQEISKALPSYGLIPQ